VREGRASRTADRVAQRRAAHQILDRPLVFEDPLAVRIVERVPEDHSRLAPYFRAAFAVRSRFAEDALGEAVQRRVRQYVILGAGLDTFAYRNPFPQLRVIEVDHPATQKLKRERLAAAGIEVPGSVTYLPIDFAATRLADALKLESPAFFSWLGVVPYLEVPAIRETFRFVASHPASELVFDFGSRPESLSFAGRMVFRMIAARVASVGEPFKTFFEPQDLARTMRECGFSAVDVLSPDELNRRYFSGRTDALRLGGMLHMARGIV
jgi:methyltransferase (TIGR00027 family)